MSLYIPYILSSEMKHPVRRCLFERPTAEKQEKDFETQESRLFKQEQKVFREKWGLDPKTGSIVNGAEYECVPVDLSQESIPSFYTKGYAPRKPRPVQSLRRERGLSILPMRLNFDFPKPLKRKYPSENEVQVIDDHDENNESAYAENIRGSKRVPTDGDIVIVSPASIDSGSSNSFSSFSSDDSNSPISLPISSCLLHQTKLIKSPSMPDISPRSADQSTPQQRPRSLTQKTIKDYLPCKKQRCATKVLPRT